MDILITGNLEFITDDFYEGITDERKKIVLAGENSVIKGQMRKRMLFPYAVFDEPFAKLFLTFNFDFVIFISHTIDGKEHKSGENDQWNRVLELCSQYKIEHVIYITSSSGARDLECNRERITTSYELLIQTGKDLCDLYRKTKSLSIIMVTIPYIFGMEEGSGFVNQLLEKILLEKEIEFPFQKEQSCDFIHIEDIGNFINRLLDDWPEDIEVIPLTSGKIITFEDLAQSIHYLNRQIPIVYAYQYNPSYPIPIATDTARTRIGWIPLKRILTELPELVYHYEIKVVEEKRVWIKKIQEYWKKHKLALKFIELIAVFLVTEFLNIKLGTYVQFQYVDLRLLFIVIMGSVHGMSMGIIAAGLACMSTLYGYVRLGVDWKIIFYNIENWLPFVSYMLVGAIIGSGKDQNKDRIRMLNEQYNLLEERYLYLSDLYNNALQNKEQFKDQIVGYKDSFGRLYDVTLKLNNTMPEAVFKEALEVMEDILSNQSIAIYTLSSGSSYARLNLCSKPLNNKLMRSISLDSYHEMSKDLKDGAVWFNKEYLEGYPIYCAPIYKQEELVSLVMIYEVSYAQLAMYYVNLIRIICGLLQNSLVRAIDYEGMAGQDIYYENTMIMKKERFAELLNVKNELQEKDFSNYILLRLNIKSDDLKEVSDLVVSRVRVSDVIGIGPDDKVYLILSQVTDDNAEYAYKRLLQAGISFKRVSTTHLMKRQESL